MAITVNKPLIPATTQSYEFSNVSISRSAGVMSAVVQFTVLDAKGKRSDQHTVSLTGEAYNKFWAAFNTGTYLYQVLAADLKLAHSQIPVAKSQEAEFINAPKAP